MTESLCMYVIGVEDGGKCQTCRRSTFAQHYIWNNDDHPYQPPVRRCLEPFTSWQHFLNGEGTHPFTVEAVEA